MRLALACFAFLALVDPGASAPAGAVPRALASGLVINEFMAGPARDWDGSGTFSSRDDEWIEVVNAGTAGLDLAGYLITDGDSIPRLPLSGTLAPGERRLLFGKAAYDWERANGYPAFGFSLGNSGDAVMVWHVAGTDTTLVDSYAYHSHEAAADRSVGHVNDSGGWGLFDGLNPYTGTTQPLGTGCSPTPGTMNTCQITPTAGVSWGRVKSIYR